MLLRLFEGGFWVSDCFLFFGDLVTFKYFLLLFVADGCFGGVCGQGFYPW